MSHENKPVNEEVEVELEEMEDGSDIIELTDEEGVVTEFQYLTTLDHEGEIKDSQGQIEDVLPARVRVHVRKQAAQQCQRAHDRQLRHVG